MGLFLLINCRHIVWPAATRMRMLCVGVLLVVEFGQCKMWLVCTLAMNDLVHLSWSTLSTSSATPSRERDAVLPPHWLYFHYCHQRQLAGRLINAVTRWPFRREW